ncbi:hypothetical protein ACV3U6_07695 [Clostridium perfringens]
MIDWSLYKGRDTERSKKAYEGFVKLLENEGYRLVGEYVNVRTKIEIQCNEGHKYEVRPDKFKMGRRCPICSGHHPETARIQFEEKVGNEGYKLVGDYVNNSTKVEIMCDKGHRYSVTPNSFKSGRRCPICSSKHPETAKEYFIKQVKDEGYKLVGDYVNSKTKLELECNKGHKYFVNPNNFKTGYRCPICSNRHPETAKLDFINQVENEGYKLIGEYKNTMTKIELQCNKGHRYSVTPSDFKNGTRCSICAGNNPETAKLEFIKQVESEGYTVIGDYVNSKTKLELECNKGHKYFVKPNSFKTGNRCPHCNTISHGERLTRKILEECKLGFEQQKKFDGLTGLGGRALSYDFFVEGYLLIEIQGEQHYKPIDLFGREERFKQQQEHDKRKREFAINNGYKLLEIPYFSTRDLDNLEKTLREELNNLLVLEEVS